MPYVRIAPDMMLEQDGVEVFHLYDANGWESEYWFTTNPDNADEFYGHRSRGQFDARLLAGRWETTPTVAQWDDFWKPRFKTEDDAIHTLVREAIASGSIGNCNA